MPAISVAEELKGEKFILENDYVLCLVHSIIVLQFTVQ